MDSGQNTSTTPGDQYPIYVGIWTNWSRGPVFGSTLTLSRRDADLLIAFTAFFIAFVTTRVWRIVCFVFHRTHSTADPRDAIYHQRQTIFRNSSSPESGVQMLLWLLWANRGSKGWLRPLPAAIVAIFCITVFTVAGGFSSRISTAVGDEALIKSSNCGFTQAANDASDPSYFSALSNEATIISNAANYAQQCYSNGKNAGLLDCNRFTTRQVAKKIDKQADCPFKNDLCRSRSENLRIDSGFLDSHDILGFNAPPNKRILFRNVLQCAPLITSGYTHEGNSSLGEYTFYNYGTIIDSSSEKRNYIHAAPSVHTQYAPIESEDIPVVSPSYVLSVYHSAVKDQTTCRRLSTFVPIPDVFRKDADLSIFLLSGNGVVFSQFSADDWYHLNKTPSVILFPIESSGRSELYTPTEPASPLGCVQQYQFCSTAFPGTSGCGPLASLRDAIAGASPFFDITYRELYELSSRGEAGALFSYFANMYFSASSPSIVHVVGQLGATSLTSRDKLFTGVQGPIASNQWQYDVVHWWDIAMAAQQSAPLSQAYFPNDSDVGSLRYNYTAPEFRRLCSNQKIRTTAYASFSLFGLLFTFTSGLLLTLASYLLEPISGCLHNRKGSNKYPHLEWITNSTLQLQRLAHEEMGFGTWSEGTETIPVTKHGEMLGSLDISNPKHPVLRRMTSADDDSLTAETRIGTPLTVIGDESEPGDISPAPSNGLTDGEPQAISSDNLLQIESGRLETECRIASPSDSLPLEETARRANSEELQHAQGIPSNDTVNPSAVRLSE